MRADREPQRLGVAVEQELHSPGSKSAMLATGEDWFPGRLPIGSKIEKRLSGSI